MPTSAPRLILSSGDRVFANSHEASIVTFLITDSPSVNLNRGHADFKFLIENPRPSNVPLNALPRSPTPIPCQSETSAMSMSFAR